jgi:hypothetical protein
MEVAPSEPDTDVHKRIASVGKLILRESWRFWRSLPPRSQGQYGIDDLIQECWKSLLKEDHCCDLERFPGEYSYAMFATLTIRRRLQLLRGKARIVQTPKGAKAIIRDRPQSRDAIRLRVAGRRVVSSVPDVIPADVAPVLDQIIDRESAEIAKQAVTGALAQLPRRDQLVVRAMHGIGGATRSQQDLADAFGYQSLRGLTARCRKAESHMAAILSDQG